MRSSAAICWLTADWVNPSRPAAAAERALVGDRLEGEEVADLDITERWPCLHLTISRTDRHVQESSLVVEAMFTHTDDISTIILPTTALPSVAGTTRRPASTRPAAFGRTVNDLAFSVATDGVAAHESAVARARPQRLRAGRRRHRRRRPGRQHGPGHRRAGVRPRRRLPRPDRHVRSAGSQPGRLTANRGTRRRHDILP